MEMILKGVDDQVTRLSLANDHERLSNREG
jgi:hypothetical protein